MIIESYVIFPREEGWLLRTPSGNIGPFKTERFAIDLAKKYVSNLTKGGNRRGYSISILVRDPDGQARLAHNAFSPEMLRHP